MHMSCNVPCVCMGTSSLTHVSSSSDMIASRKRKYIDAEENVVKYRCLDVLHIATGTFGRIGCADEMICSN